MRVLLISHIFPPAIDGGSKVVYKLGQYLESQNYQTLYLSSDCSSTDDFIKSKYLKSDKLTSDQLKVDVYHHLRRPLKFINLFFNSDLLRIFQKGPILKIIPLIKAIIKVIRFKPDLIIAGPLPTTIVIYAHFLKKITKAKLLINASFHPTDPDFHQLPLIKSLQTADYLWTLTQSESDYFINHFKINPKKIILAGNGVDQQFLKKEKTKELTHLKLRSEKLKSEILFIGSLAAHKRVNVLISSFSDFISSLPQGRMSTGQVGLIIAGQKTFFYPQIEKLIDSLDSNIKSKIKFIFDFPQKDLSKLIDSCDVLVLPSIQESFGLVVIEAWARKKPVICTNIPALKELVEKSNGGLTFEIDNQKDLAEKIKLILDNPQKSQQMGQNGYEYVKNNYTWTKVGQKICQKILS